jgi:hypothetical protein
VAFEFELRDSKTGMAVWSHSYSHDEAVKGNDVNSVVAALDLNVQSGLIEIFTALDQYFSAHVQAGSGTH